LKGKRFIDTDFTLRNFIDSLAKENADGRKKYSAIHIASHFQLGNSWTNSFLLMGNNKILTLEQLSNSPEIDFGDVELVTLSACDTAIGENSNGKEIDSLAEAIQTKSGKSILATLWSVADISTPLFMTEFYRIRQENPKLTKAEIISQVQTLMINGKIKPSESFIELLNKEYEKNAQDKSRVNKFVFDKTKPFAHPYFWSPFVLIGNWR
jgi:CHAT domain-containing protein